MRFATRVHPHSIQLCPRGGCERPNAVCVARILEDVAPRRTTLCAASPGPQPVVCYEDFLRVRASDFAMHAIRLSGSENSLKSLRRLHRSLRLDGQRVRQRGEEPAKDGDRLENLDSREANPSCKSVPGLAEAPDILTNALRTREGPHASENLYNREPWCEGPNEGGGRPQEDDDQKRHRVDSPGSSRRTPPDAKAPLEMPAQGRPLAQELNARGGEENDSRTHASHRFEEVRVLPEAAIRETPGLKQQVLSD